MNSNIFFYFFFCENVEDIGNCFLRAAIEEKKLVPYPVRATGKSCRSVGPCSVCVFMRVVTECGNVRWDPSTNTLVDACIYIRVYDAYISNPRTQCSSRTSSYVTIIDHTWATLRCTYMVSNRIWRFPCSDTPNIKTQIFSFFFFNFTVYLLYPVKSFIPKYAVFYAPTKLHLRDDCSGALRPRFVGTIYNTIIIINI